VVADDRHDVGVSGNDPELVPRVPVDRVGLPQAPEERVRIPDRVVGEQVIEVNVLECRCH
jgi:hypothetical protein